MIETFYSKASYNIEKLIEEIQAAFPQNLGIFNGDGESGLVSGIRVRMPDDTTQQTFTDLQSLITAHNANVLTENQQVEDAQKNLALLAKNYLGKQYLKANPDSLDTIFTTVKAVVDAKPAYVTIQANRYAIMRVAFGWPAVQDTSGALGRARYLETIQSLIAIYS